jgi:hypothetical protein
LKNSKTIENPTFQLENGFRGCFLGFSSQKIGFFMLEKLFSKKVD